MPIEIMELVIKASVAAAGSEAAAGGPTPNAPADENGGAGEAEQLAQQVLDILKRKNER
jgi:hypothetical protein